MIHDLVASSSNLRGAHSALRAQIRQDFREALGPALYLPRPLGSTWFNIRVSLQSGSLRCGHGSASFVISNKISLARAGHDRERLALQRPVSSSILQASVPHPSQPREVVPHHLSLTPSTIQLSLQVPSSACLNLPQSLGVSSSPSKNILGALW